MISTGFTKLAGDKLPEFQCRELRVALRGSEPGKSNGRRYSARRPHTKRGNLLKRNNHPEERHDERPVIAACQPRCLWHPPQTSVRRCVGRTSERNQVPESPKSAVLHPASASWRRSTRRHAGGRCDPPIPKPAARSHPADISWKVGQHLTYGFGSQGGSAGHRSENFRPGDVTSHFTNRGRILRTDSPAPQLLGHAQVLLFRPFPDAARLIFAHFEGNGRHG